MTVTTPPHTPNRTATNTSETSAPETATNKDRRAFMAGAAGAGATLAGLAAVSPVQAADMAMPKDLAGKTAFVTGAARGIGVKIIEPGIIATDFAGRSFDFANDPPIDEYQDIVGKVISAFAGNPVPPSPPELVAEVIFSAVTDGTSRLRYRAGADAEALLDYRRDVDDDTFLAGIKAQFGL